VDIVPRFIQELDQFPDYLTNYPANSSKETLRSMASTVPPRDWTEIHWPDIAKDGVKADAARWIAVLPLAATEQHGPHLPLETDTLLATDVAAAIVARTPGTLVGPVVSMGCSSHHLMFPGTVSLRVRTFVATVVDLCRSLSAAGITAVLLNAHGGNRAPLGVALIELADERIRAYGFTYWELLADVVAEELGPAGLDACGHACALETSLMQHLHPGSVRDSLIPADATPGTWPNPHMFSSDVVEVVRPFEEIKADGVVGRPSLATPELGQRLFDAAVERGSREVERIMEVSS
jgi:creatinine amidohydrolase